MSETHAYLVLASRLTTSLESSLEDLRASGRVFVHLDRADPAQALGPEFISDRVFCAWGDVSLVRATLNLMEVALKDPELRRFTLVSDSCVPLYEPRVMRAELAALGTQDLITVERMTEDQKRHSFRPTLYQTWREFKKRANRSLSRLPARASIAFRLKRSLEVFTYSFWRKLSMALGHSVLQWRGRYRPLPPLALARGGQWWSLTRATCEGVLDCCRDRPELLRMFARAEIPDEVFIQSLVATYFLAQVRAQESRVMPGNAPASPLHCVWGPSLNLNQARAKGVLFARNSGEDLRVVRQHLRG